MKILAFLVFISYLPRIVESVACATCKSDYDTAVGATGATNGQKCTAAKTFITCLETDFAACKNTDLKTYGETATGDISTLGDDCPVPTTSTCNCQMNAIKADVTAGDAAVCSNAQSAIKCLRGTTDDGCSATRAVAATAYGALITSKCTGGGTKTCACEITHAKATVKEKADQCTAAKTLVKCVRDSDDAGCDETRILVGTAAEALIDGVGASDCPKSTTCGCEIAHTKAATSNAGEKCSAAKTLVKCVRDSDDAGCVDTRILVGTAAEALIDGVGPSDCPKTGTCACEIDHAKAAVSSDAEKCTAAKALASCLQTTKDAGCTETRVLVGTFAETKTKPSTCETTDVCGCEVDYGKADITNTIKECSTIKAKLSCLNGKNTTGCDGTSYMLVGVSSRKVLSALTSCDKTATCKCETDYASADLSTKEKQCSAANSAKECLQNITSTTEVGCDASSKAADVITNFAQPLIDAYCGAASLNGVGLTVGILIMLLEMTRWI